jgi:hypothetical protein
LWVLAKMPEGGPERFHDEARELIERRRQRASRQPSDGG